MFFRLFDFRRAFALLIFCFCCCHTVPPYRELMYSVIFVTAVNAKSSAVACILGISSAKRGRINCRPTGMYETNKIEAHESLDLRRRSVVSISEATRTPASQYCQLFRFRRSSRAVTPAPLARTQPAQQAAVATNRQLV
jgi:hypothetical protein